MSVEFDDYTRGQLDACAVLAATFDKLADEAGTAGRKVERHYLREAADTCRIAATSARRAALVATIAKAGEG